MYWQCTAEPGYNTTCPKGGSMYHRITPSYQTINESLERAIPPMDQQIADQAIKTLATLASRSAPWFCAVGFHLPHLPELVPERFVNLYPEEEVLLPDNQFAPAGMPAVAWSNSGELRSQYSDARALNSSGRINSTLPPDFTRALRRHYYGAVSYLDHNVGRVLAALKDQGQEDDTIAVLWGDHGCDCAPPFTSPLQAADKHAGSPADQLGEHGIWCKVTDFELAVHTVLMVSMPGAAPGRSDSFVEFVDAELTFGHRLA